MITKARKQGNSLTLTIPKDFHVEEGAKMRPERTDDGILYRFVEEEDDFFDFSSDILSDLINEGLEGANLLSEFKKRKHAIKGAFHKMAQSVDDPAMTREELENLIGLSGDH